MKRLTIFFLCLIVLTFLVPVSSVYAVGTFGYTDVGANNIASDNSYKDATRAQFTGTTGSDLISISVYFASTGTCNVKVALYADNSGVPGALLSSNTTGTAKGSGAQWLTVNCAYGDLTNNAYYWLTVKQSAASVTYRTADSGSANYYYESDTYTNAFTNPYGSGDAENRNVSIYGTYSSGTAHTASLTLGLAVALNVGTQWVAHTAETLGITQSLNGAIVSAFNVAETLGITSTLNAVVVSVFNVAASLSASLGLNVAVASAFNIAASLGIGLGLAVDAILSGATAHFADLSLGFGLGSDVAVQWVANIPATLSILSTLNGAVASAFNVALTNGFSLASDVVANLYTPIAHVADLTLGVVLALAVGAVLLGGVSMEGLNFILAIVGISLAVVALLSFVKDR